MYLRITRGRFDPAQFDQILPPLHEISEVARRLPGNASIVQGADRATGAFAAVSTWDTEEHARFSRDVLGDPVARLQTLGVQLDPPEIYEATTQ